MDQPEYPAGKSPRRELQGPRPAPLKVRKDSHKIRKPPVAPTNPSQQPPHHHHHNNSQQHRQPVIIYTVSPKVIHTDPSEFMSLVQRLTGSSSTSTSTSTSDFDSGSISPAARFAAMERTNKPSELRHQQQLLQHGGGSSTNDIAAGIDMISTEIERSSLFPGILSPGPGALPTIPAHFFSPPSDQNHHHNNQMSFFHDLSPVLQGNRSYLENSFMTSPSPTFFSISPHITSPTPSLDLFNNFFDS